MSEDIEDVVTRIKQAPDRKYPDFPAHRIDPYIPTSKERELLSGKYPWLKYESINIILSKGGDIIPYGACVLCGRHVDHLYTEGMLITCIRGITVRT